MTPFMFGRAGRRLFGIFHERAPAAHAGGAVLVCNPFGQEAIRAHRMFRVLAERLARAGHDCLRFDYFGTGDSAGDDEDGDLEGWVDDVLTAHVELQRRSRTSRPAWVAPRLGASIAVLAARRVPAPAPRLVLWDPVIDGRDYLALLRDRHVESLERSYGLPDATWRRRLEADPGAFADEAIGFAIPGGLRRQIERLDGAALSPPSAGELHVLARPEDTVVSAWLQSVTARGSDVCHWPLSHHFDWAAAEAMNTTLVPAHALARMMASICE